jgi:hypothetical protein
MSARVDVRPSAPDTTQRKGSIREERGALTVSNPFVVGPTTRQPILCDN